MTVRDLIEALAKLPGDLDVYCKDAERRPVELGEPTVHRCYQVHHTTHGRVDAYKQFIHPDVDPEWAPTDCERLGETVERLRNVIFLGEQAT